MGGGGGGERPRVHEEPSTQRLGLTQGGKLFGGGKDPEHDFQS